MRLRRRVLVGLRKIRLQYYQMRVLSYKENKYRYMEQLKVILMLMNPKELFSIKVRAGNNKGVSKYLSILTAMSINDVFYRVTIEDLKSVNKESI